MGVNCAADRAKVSADLPGLSEAGIALQELLPYSEIRRLGFLLLPGLVIG